MQTDIFSALNIQTQIELQPTLHTDHLSFILTSSSYCISKEYLKFVSCSSLHAGTDRIEAHTSDGQWELHFKLMAVTSGK